MTTDATQDRAALVSIFFEHHTASYPMSKKDAQRIQTFIVKNIMRLPAADQKVGT